MPARNSLSNPFSTPQQRRYPVGAACLGSAISLIEKLYRVRRHLCNVGAIVEASKEQATGLKEINTAVNAMDQGTQQNAAMVEETTAAAHTLRARPNNSLTFLDSLMWGRRGCGQMLLFSHRAHPGHPFATWPRRLHVRSTGTLLSRGRSNGRNSEDDPVEREPQMSAHIGQRFSIIHAGEYRFVGAVR